MLELVTNNLHLAGLILAGLVAVLLGFFVYRKFSSKGTPLAELDEVQEPMPQAKAPQSEDQSEPELEQTQQTE